jgi:hypothetical protein
MDATKNMINNQKKHQIPEKSKEQMEQEAFMNSPITRQETMEYVQQTVASVTISFNTIFSIFQKTLITKGLVTLEDLEKVSEEVLKKQGIIQDEAKDDTEPEKSDITEDSPKPSKDNHKKHK